MNIKLVKYTEAGRPYIQQVVEKYYNGKKYIKYIRRTYGMVKECLTCKTKFFTKSKKDNRPQNYCSKKCIKRFTKGTHRAIGSIIRRKSGYCEIMCPEHPKANMQFRVPLHRFLIEKQLGRILEDWEVVHHVDYNKENNNLNNLRVMSAYDHSRLHITEKWIQTKSWNKNKLISGWIKCEKKQTVKN